MVLWNHPDYRSIRKSHPHIAASSVCREIQHSSVDDRICSGRPRVRPGLRVYPLQPGGHPADYWHSAVTQLGVPLAQTLEGSSAVYSHIDGDGGDLSDVFPGYVY